MTTFLSFTTGLFLGWIVRGFVEALIEDYKQGQALKENLKNKRDWVDDIVVGDKSNI